MNSFKLGVVDSGIGGLTVVKDLLQNNLNIEVFYISDANNVPYGNKEDHFIFERLSLMTDKLIREGAEAIVIACNTATAKTIKDLREKYSLPFIGVEPYINYINHDEKQDEHKYALILTEATSKSERFKKLRMRLDPEGIVDIYPLKKLAFLIEGLKHLDFSEIEEEIIKEISEINKKGYTHLILGCTHYPIIKKFLEDKLKVKTVDPTPKITQFIKEKFNLQEVKSKSPLTFNYNYDASNLWKIKNLTDFSFLFL